MNTSPQPHQQVRRRHRGLAGTLAALALVATLTACGDDKADGPTASTGSNAALIPPVIVDVADVDGMTLGIDVAGTIDIKVPEATVAEWTPDITDPAIVHFVPGRTDGSATFNPGLVGDQAGETTVKLDNTTSGTTVSFTVQVSGS
jgi:hypothetical protein